MASIENIITLIEKGYSKDEIDNLLAQDEIDVPAGSQEDANESQEEASESQEVETTVEDVADTPLDLLTKQVQDLAKQVQDMTAAVQLQNVKTAEQPAGANKEMSAQDFLAQLINPNLFKEDNNT